MRSDQLPLVTLDLRHAGELLAHPCDCGRPQCTLGSHIWRATQDMRPGPRAQNTDPKVRGTTSNDSDPSDDPALHLEYLRLITAAWRNARELNDFLGRLRPDRILRNPPILTGVEDWCENHLSVIGVCEPRYRGDLCRFCYEVQLAEGVVPPQSILVMRHRGERLTADEITRAVTPLRPKVKRGKKRKAS